MGMRSSSYAGPLVLVRTNYRAQGIMIPFRCHLGQSGQLEQYRSPACTHMCQRRVSTRYSTPTFQVIDASGCVNNRIHMQTELFLLDPCLEGLWALNIELLDL